MSLTELDFTILQKFFCAIERRTGMPAQPLDATPEQIAMAEQKQSDQTKPLLKGVVLGPDGKPCRTCSSAMSWKSMLKQHGSDAKPSSPLAPPTDDCPPDVEQLGRSSWTLLHSITAQYPDRPSFSQQFETTQFLGLFGKMYPCWVCADDFQAWMKGNQPRVSNREDFGRWMCEAHNAVNDKLGKPSFDCNKWEERWRTGWKDGRCD